MQLPGHIRLCCKTEQHRVEDLSDLLAKRSEASMGSPRRGLRLLMHSPRATSGARLDHCLGKELKAASQNLQIAPQNIT